MVFKKLLVMALALSVLTLAILFNRANSTTPSVKAWASAQSELSLVGSSSLNAKKGDQFADIWVHGKYAYLGTFSQGIGVKIVDVSDPANPKLVKTLPGKPKTSDEDVMVISANSTFFQGDLLAVGLQSTSGDGKNSGVQFWDVSNPTDPKLLSFYNVGQIKNGFKSGVHELYLFQRDERIFVLLAVPFSEGSKLGGDFRLIEVTDPRNPKPLSDWGLKNLPEHDDDLLHPQHEEGEAGLNTKFCHSVWTDDEKKIAYLSYWDEGSIMLDMTDPTDLKFIGHTHYEAGDEGNAHSSWRIKNTNTLIVNTEDFTVDAISLKVTTPNVMELGKGSITQLNAKKTVCDVGNITAEVISLGEGCSKDDYINNDLNGKIVIVDTPDNTKCMNTAKKVINAQKAGAKAVIQTYQSGFSFSVKANQILTIPVLSASQFVMKPALDLLANGEKVTLSISPDANETWGYAKFYDISDPDHPRPISRFATPNSLSCSEPDGTFINGYTVHNPFVVGNLAYFSWYGDGVRVVDISDPINPTEVAAYVPPNSSVWGVYVQDDLIYMSDIRGGIYIVKNVGK